MKRLVPILMLLVAWGVMLLRLDSPWWGLGDENGAWISSTVRNWQVYGVIELRFMQVTNTGPASPDSYAFYTHHPPLVPWVSALSAAIFGFHEASLRYVSISATLISMAAFYTFSRRLMEIRQACWAMAFYTFTPMMLYYGRMPDHEALALALLMGFMAVFVRWLRAPARQHYIALLVLGVLGAWTAWATLIFTGLAGIMALRVTRRWQAIIGLGLIILLAVVGMLIYYQLIYPQTIPDLLVTYFWRVSNQSGSEGTAPFTLMEYVTRQAIHLLMLMTPGLLILGVIGVVRALRQSGPHRRILLVLSGAALLYIFVFRNAAYIHDYYKIYFAPALALSASYAMVGFRRSGQHWRRYGPPLVAGLVIVSIILGGVFLLLLHQSSHRPYLDRMRQIIAEQTGPDDRIMTNTDYAIPAVAFYTFRYIARNVPPQQAHQQAGEQGIFYIYCDTDARLPEAFVGLDYTADEDCFYIRISGSHS